MAIFTVDILFVVVIVFVVFATTFVCQIFGKMTAEKVFESLVQSDDEMEKTEKTFIVKDEDSASLSSYNESNYISPERRKIVKKRRGRQKRPEPETRVSKKHAELRVLANGRHEKRSKYRRRANYFYVTSTDDSWAKRREEGLRKARAFPIFTDHDFIGQEPGTFGRLGIPAADNIDEKIPIRMHSFFKQLEDRNLSPHYQSTTISSETGSQVPPIGSRFMRRPMDNNCARRLDFNQNDSLLQASENNNCRNIVRGFQAPGVVISQPQNEQYSEMSMRTGSNSVFFSENPNEKSSLIQMDQNNEISGEEKSEAKQDFLVQIEPPSPVKNSSAAGYKGPFTTPLSAEKDKLQVFPNSCSSSNRNPAELQFYSASRCANCLTCRQDLFCSPGHTL